MLGSRCAALLCFLLLVARVSVNGAPREIVLQNNQPFPIRMPVELRGISWTEPTPKIGKQDAQISGSNVFFVADIAAGQREVLKLGRGPTRSSNAALRANPTDTGLGLAFEKTSVGSFDWDIVLHSSTAPQEDTDSGQPGHPDFDAAFRPLPMKFERRESGPVFESWVAQTVKEGLQLEVTLRVFYAGFVDLRARLLNESAKSVSNVYAAVVCRWEQPRPAARSLCYDNHTSDLGDHAHSLFREGPGRHLFIQRGVDWVRTSFANEIVAGWMNDFAPSFTVAAPATAKTPARYIGANEPQLGQEIQTAGPRLYSITEIARSSVKSFRDRLKENILPPRGESVSFASRIVFSNAQLTDRALDQMFVGWTSYNEQRVADAEARVAFGVSAVRFGTSYFPYSTLGENFDAQKLPGMDRESFWPLAADTVNKWRLFAGDIRRDLRIAKAMGFQLIRLHHLELLAPIDPKVREEYLDFLFGEMRFLGLKALIDVYASPEQIVQLVSRYRDVIESVEIENEVLIWGIPLDRPAYWKEVYSAVKKAAPEVRVNLTGYNNTGIFDRLSALGVPFDRVCLHSYIDSLEALPSARGYSLALSSYATRTGKPPVITEWNWRGLTRMTEIERAKIYPQIIEGAIGTRGIPDFYQFQFNETLAPNPRVGRGNILRHYELLHLSRRAKPEALVLMDLILKYARADDPFRTIQVSHEVVHLDAQGHGTASVRLQNKGARAESFRISMDPQDEIRAIVEGPSTIKLAPAGQQSIPITLAAAATQAGFYHAFLRITNESGLLRYAWIEARQPHSSPLPSDANFFLGRAPLTIVYGKDAPPQEVETAITIAETLESASGRPIDAAEADPSRDNQFASQSVVLVGTKKSHHLLRSLKSLPESVGKADLPGGTPCFVITGKDSLAVERAGMDFVLSYWQKAKDSAARRVGLVAKELPRGVDAAKLP